jgi:DNA polymerase-3 subunit epsilon
MRQIILDTETTGLSAAAGHRMIEIAGIELINRRPTGRHYHQYLCPERDIEAEAVAVHGLTEAFLADKPLFQEIAEALLAFLEGAELVIHNAPFDVSFLNSEFKQAGAHFKPITEYCRILDTLALARKKHPGQQNNLDALCRRYKVDNSARDLHGALMDADLLTQVYLAMTGGQTTLFGRELETHHSEALQIVASSMNHTDVRLKVIQANAEELEAHTARLQAIQQAGGGVCLWE